MNATHYNNQNSGQQVNKQDFWKKDWFLGLVIVITFAALYISTNLTQGVGAYDLGLNASNAEPNKQVAVLTIDDKSLDNIGRWPWSRHIHAKAIAKLKAAGAKVIGHTAFFLSLKKILA